MWKIFFLFAILLFPAGIMTPVQAQPAEPAIPVQEIIDNRKDIVQTFPNGTALVSHKFFTSEVLDYVDYQGKPVYKKFKYNEDVNHISFESAAITFTYDKSTCGIKVFEKGRLKQNSQPVLDWVGVSLKEATINGTDWVDSAVNFVQCQTTPIQVTENGIEFSAIKQNANGIFETRYVADYGSGLEDFYIYNNTAGIDKQFGYTTVVNNKLNLKIGGAMINRQYITDTITLNTTEPVKLENGLVIDKMNEPMFLLQRHKPTQDVYDFTKGKHLKKNEVLVVDPKITYTSTTITDFTVPSYVTSITIKAWGAGGGGATTVSSVGGGGGFAKGTITVTEGQVYKVVVGGGGTAGYSINTGAGGANGGGNAGGVGYSGGGGGGYSGVFLSSVSQANAKVIAGGGGGTGGGGGGGSGGAGGGTSGSNGGASSGGTGSSGGGSGGTQSSGGSGGGGTSGSNGGTGSSLQGGTGGNAGAANGGSGGGGGGGYYGGGGGGGGSAGNNGGGGGGGSGFVHSSATNTANIAGSGSSVANSSDPDYVSGKGNGSPSGSNTNGQNGLVVILYNVIPPNPPSNFTADSQVKKVQYSWTPSSGSSEVTGYYISRSLNNNTWTNATLTGNVTSYLDSAYYRAGLLYYARINATVGASTGPNAYTSFVMDNVPSAPTLIEPLTRINNSVVKASSLAGTTDGGDTVLWFGLRCAVNQGNWVNVVTNSSIPANRQYNVTGLYSDGNAITCQWRDGNRVGFSSWSNNATYPPKPAAVRNLQLVSVFQTTAQIQWSQPNLYGLPLLGYQVNFTTPWGNPLTTITVTNTSDTKYLISGLTPNTQYSFRVSAVTVTGKNGSGNIVNVETPTSFQVGQIDIDNSNPFRQPIRFSEDRINQTTTKVTVTYNKNFDLKCDLAFQNSRTKQTYNHLAGSQVTADEKAYDFYLNNPQNDITSFECVDNHTNTTGTFLVKQDDFVLLQLIENFRDGTFGTKGQFGAIDLITLIAIIIGMIGFNRTNPAVGGIFMFFVIGGLAWFGIVQWYTAAGSMFALILFLVVASTRKDE